ncbi:hypothetical protein RND71_018697 [Anisodus tanguticus]|uniref:Uncharacterized protein n=1 Tax=Anisodus tanguticus TaxID=243964 RepID=A0AAE1S6N2_9SOLA|nr:hypothetical protein RND71_018697 [Anisodus tanguticus]
MAENEFGVLQFFVVDESEETVLAPNISHHDEPCLKLVDVGTDCDSGEEDEDDNGPYPSGYNNEDLELLRKEKNREVNAKLDRFLVLEHGMTFKNLEEAKRVNKRSTQQALAHYFKNKVQNNPTYKVDAALDLSHTQNIGRMIKSHFPHSQFIVVSLKEGMFNNANVLFRTKFVDGVSTVQRTVAKNK